MIVDVKICLVTQSVDVPKLTCPVLGLENKILGVESRNQIQDQVTFELGHAFTDALALNQNLPRAGLEVSIDLRENISLTVGPIFVPLLTRFRHHLQPLRSGHLDQ